MGLGLATVHDGDWAQTRRNFQRINSVLLGPDSTPTFAGTTISGLTSNSLLYSAGGVVTALGVATDGQLPTGSTGAAPVLATLTATANRVTVANAAGSITLSTPQDTHTGATMVLSGLLPAATETYDLGAYAAGSTVGSPMGLLLSLTYASGAGTNVRWRHLYLSGNLSDGTNTLTIANCKTAFDHVTESGASHSYIDQAVTIAATPTFGGVIIADGGTVGQAAGPLMTFDDTNNYLEITGCSVGIGAAAPGRLLEISGASGNIGLRITQTDNSISADFITSAASGVWLETTTNHPLYFAANGGDADLTIQTDGNLLVVNKTLYRDSAIGVYSQADTFLDLFADGAVRIGDSSAGAPTNYINFAADGELTLTGTARVEQFVESLGISGRGGSAPTARTTETPYLSWTFNIGDDTHQSFEAPYAMDYTDTVTVKVHWYTSVSQVADEVAFQAVWNAIPEAGGEVINAGATTITSADTNCPTQWHIAETTVGTIAGNAISQDDMIGLHLERVALDGGGDDPDINTIHILSIEFEYYMNKLGEPT